MTIDLIQLREALRHSGFAGDVPFHMTDAAHESKLLKLRDELVDGGLFDDIEELEERIGELEIELEAAS